MREKCALNTLRSYVNHAQQVPWTVIPPKILKYIGGPVLNNVTDERAIDLIRRSRVYARRKVALVICLSVFGAWCVAVIVSGKFFTYLPREDETCSVRNLRERVAC